METRHEFLTADEAAKYIGIDRLFHNAGGRVNRWRREEKLRGMKMGVRWFYRPKDLDKFIERGIE